MKKVLLFVAVITAFSFVSCKKDRVCTCTNSANGTVISTEVVTYTKSMKGDARENCMSQSWTDDNVAYVVDCKLK